MKLNEIKKNRGYDLLLLSVTDIIKDGSFIFYDTTNESLIGEAFQVNEIKEGFFLKHFLSRKKQLVPPILNVIR